MTDSQLMNLIQIAQQQLANKNFQQAQLISQQILNMNANSFDGWLIKSIASQNLIQYDQALQSINNVVSINPSFEMGYLIKTQILKAQLKEKEALITCESALNKFNKNPQLWLEYSELLYKTDAKSKADEAFKQHLIYSAHTVNLQHALQAFFMNDLLNSEKKVRKHLSENPQDPSALRLLGEIALNLGVYEDAQRLFEKALIISPNYHLARLNYAHTLNKRELNTAALIQIQKLEKHQPNHPPILIVKGAILVKLARYQEAIDLYLYLLNKQANQAEIWASLGHTYKTIGETEKALEAYNKAILFNAEYGDAFWSLANLKTYEFTCDQIEQMKAAYKNQKSNKTENLAQICFALGKAFETRKNIEQSFNFYKLGNDIKKLIEPYAADEIEQLVHRNKAFFSQKTLEPINEENNNVIPIFIVGLPRSGSTLLEQILSSHSAIDGTKELPDIMSIARRLGNRKKKKDQDLYPYSLANLSKSQLSEIGNKYIENCAHLRNGAPYFIDKMPNNFLHVGLIKTILPQAKIIDARRLPVSSGFSCFKQLFAVGQTFSNDILDIKHYYQNYLELMAFWQQQYHEGILTVHYEDVIENTDKSVKDLLTFIGLPFEESCLSFYKNKRAVATASAEQVRQPINSKGLNAWQPYSKYLMPLIELSN